MDNITIYVCTHKKFNIFYKNGYVPLLCGAKYNDVENVDYLKDNTGDNISELNPYYSELTGLYWIWKNSDSQIVGLCHYRRYFIKHIYGNYLSKEDIKNDLTNHDIILAKKIGFTYSMYKQYTNFHYEKDLKLVKHSIKKLSPDYITSFEEFFESNEFYPNCMFISKKHIINKYCEWLFPILKDFGEKIDLNFYKNDYQKRVFAFLGERLFNVWILKNNLKVKEYYVKRTESKSNFLSIIDSNFMYSRMFDFISKNFYEDYK